MTAIESLLLAEFGPDRALVTEAALTAYECDGFTIHKQKPLAVLLPESTEEVQKAIQLLRREKTPFLARGAGTCLSGGPTAIRPSVVIETARMKHVLEVHAEDLLAVVQPGLVNSDLSRHVAHLGLHYAPDPSSQAVCTIGGNVAENSGGPHCFKYGMTTDHILGLVVVLPTGELARFGSPCGPRAHGFDLTGLFTGSEGTFGITTEITVRLSPNPESVATLLAAFASMDAACGSVEEIVAAGMIPAALEILDQGTIRAVEASVYRAGYPQEAAAVLLVELDGPVDQLSEEVDAIRSIFARNSALTIEEANDEASRARLWRGRKGAFGAMGRLKPDLYVLDGVVPRTQLVETLRKISAIAKKHQLTLTNVFHAGDGNLHPNISYDGRDEEETRRVVAAGHEILETCIAAGGSITGEHGVGSEKLDHMPLMFDENDLHVMDRVRRVFNPEELCNPGKVIPERSACSEVARWPRMAERIRQAEIEADDRRLRD
ncbi:MAG: FAD-binding oxidoreductase [Planctomycetota bacterium]